MGGPEHYRRAEALLDQAHGADNSEGYADYLVAKAQVHATLALAAATAQPIVDRYVESDDDSRAWSEATAPSAVRS